MVLYFGDIVAAALLNRRCVVVRYHFKKLRGQGSYGSYVFGRILSEWLTLRLLALKVCQLTV